MTKQYEHKKSFKDNILEMLQDHLKQTIANAFKKKFQEKKQDYLLKFKKDIERKVKREVRKATFSVAALSLAVIGLLFLLYALVQLLSAILTLPNYVTNFLFAFFLLLLGALIYGVRK